MNRLLELALWTALVVCLLFFYIPIFTLMAYSFNSGRILSIPFEGLTLDWYRELFEHRRVVPAIINSSLLALFTMLATTTLGTAAAIALMRYRFRGRLGLIALTGAPLVFPQMLLGIVLLLWFSVLGRWLDFHMGIWTAVLGHIVYIAPFVIVIVSVQIAAFDPTLEDAAADAGASPWQIYRYVTLPLLFPGILSAAIFAFLLSWGNFYLTYSLAGSAGTIPTFVFAGIATGSSPLYPALGTLVFLPGLLLVAFAAAALRRMRRRRP